MSVADIFAYDDWFDEYSYAAYRRELWAAAYIIGGGCSDDSFTDFRAWLIAQGKMVYEDALRDPETLLDLIDASDDLSNYGAERLEEMNYVGVYAYEKKMGEEMPLFAGISLMPKLSGAWWDDAMLCPMYPKLCAKFWLELCDGEAN